MALGEVLDEPSVRVEPAADAQYWIEAPAQVERRRVSVRHVLPSGLPCWADRSSSPALASLTVTRARGGGVYRVKPEEWRQIVADLGGWVSSSDDAEAILDTVREIEWKRAGQGFRSSARARKAIEELAMDRARAYFGELGYEVQDRYQSNPYDLLCTKGTETLFVEVKGTTSRGDQILLTPNEVVFARRNRGSMAMFVLRDVVASESADGAAKADGGEHVVIRPWDVDAGSLVPVGFTWSLPFPPPAENYPDEADNTQSRCRAHGSRRRSGGTDGP